MAAYLACIVGFLLAASPGFSHDWSSSRPDSHAPIGVMGDHTHLAGELMASYRFMQMEGSGILSGSGSASTGEVLSRYNPSADEF